MSQFSNSNWPEILWITAQPPVPPFTGAKIKTLGGIEAFRSLTSIHVVTFASEERMPQVESAFKEFWGHRSVAVTVMPLGSRPSLVTAMATRRFQSGTMIERSGVRQLLFNAFQNRANTLAILDDIVLAPLVTSCGGDVILSPHDCISRMHLSYASFSPMWPWAVRHYMQHQIARHYEKSFYHQALLVHVVTERDRVWLQGINPRARFHVTQIGSLDAPAHEASDADPWDLLIWADLGTPAVAEGARRVLDLIHRDGEWKSRWRVGVVGRIEEPAAERVLGTSRLRGIHYAQRLEIGEKGLQPAKIVLIPDLGGAGVKNRCVSTLASGKTLACLYSQMEGLEKVPDLGAINAPTLSELLECCKRRLEDGSYADIATRGHDLYLANYTQQHVQREWQDMVHRAIKIRDGLRSRG